MFGGLAGNFFGPSPKGRGENCGERGELQGRIWAKKNSDKLCCRNFFLGLFSIQARVGAQNFCFVGAFPWRVNVVTPKVSVCRRRLINRTAQF